MWLVIAGGIIGFIQINNIHRLLEAVYLPEKIKLMLEKLLDISNKVLALAREEIQQIMSDAWVTLHINIQTFLCILIDILVSNQIKCRWKPDAYIKN